MPYQSRFFGLARVVALIAALSAATSPSTASAQASVVHAVLFYSPTCPHCHEVINTHLPPLRDRYGDRFSIVGMDVTTSTGSMLYDAAVEYYGLAPDRLGVPLLVIGDVTLLGSLEIPEQIPGLIEEGLAVGGTPWPTLPALREVLAAQGLLPQEPAPEEAAPAADAPAAQDPRQDPRVGAPGAAAAGPASLEGAVATPRSPSDVPSVATPTGAASSAADDPATASPPESAADLTTSFAPGDPPSLTAAQRFMQDPAANAIAVVALVILLGVLVVGFAGIRGAGPPIPQAPGWVIPTLIVAGLGVAAYLSQVEITGAQAVCGPLGDCNTVQQSAFARLFGVPVGILGALGYLGMPAAWMMAVAGPQALRGQARLTLWAFALVGCAFSAYLTFLEPFVIGATCAWCVSSALIMAALLVLATGEVRRGA